MSKGNITENDIVKFIFNNIAMPAYGANLYMSLHTADPGEAGDQTTNEVSTGAYASYARIPVARDNTGFTISGSSVVNAALLQFPQCTGGSGATLTHLGLGTSASGAGQLLASNALIDTVAVSNVIQPQFPAGAFSYIED